MHLLADHLLLGEWDDAVRVAGELAESTSDRWHSQLSAMPALLINRGEVAEARACLDAEEKSQSEEVQERVMYAMAEAWVLRAEGRAQAALAVAEEGLAERGKLQEEHPFFKHMLVEAVEAAFDLDDLEKVAELLGEWERMRPVDRTPFLEGHRERFVARLAARRGERDLVEPSLIRAAELFREISMPFYLAVTLLERAELTGNEESLAEAREIFERLEAKPWLERLSRVAPVAAAAPVP